MTASTTTSRSCPKESSVDDFAAYLAGATKRLEKSEGIKVDTIDPFNEPIGHWGTRLDADGNPVARQEGADIGPELQQKVIAALEPALKKAKVKAGISAMDESTPWGSRRPGTPTRRGPRTSSAR
jgi:hypothetical protein